MIISRLATIEDAIVIATIQTAGWRHAYKSLLPAEILARIDTQKRADRYRQLLSRSNPDVVIRVAELEGDVTGYCMFGVSRDLPEANEGEVLALYVHPDHIRSGAGRLLMADAETWFRKRDFTSGVVWVLDGNNAARGFYSHLGWAPTPESHTRLLDGHPVREWQHRKQFTVPESDPQR